MAEDFLKELEGLVDLDLAATLFGGDRAGLSSGLQFETEGFPKPGTGKTLNLLLPGLAQQRRRRHAQAVAEERGDQQRALGALESAMGFTDRAARAKAAKESARLAGVKGARDTYGQLIRMGFGSDPEGIFRDLAQFQATEGGGVTVPEKFEGLIGLQEREKSKIRNKLMESIIPQASRAAVNSPALMRGLLDGDPSSVMDAFTAASGEANRESILKSFDFAQKAGLSVSPALYALVQNSTPQNLGSILASKEMQKFYSQVSMSTRQKMLLGHSLDKQLATFKDNLDGGGDRDKPLTTLQYYDGAEKGVKRTRGQFSESMERIALTTANRDYQADPSAAAGRAGFSEFDDKEGITKTIAAQLLSDPQSNQRIRKQAARFSAPTYFREVAQFYSTPPRGPEADNEKYASLEKELVQVAAELDIDMDSDAFLDAVNAALVEMGLDPLPDASGASLDLESAIEKVYNVPPRSVNGQAP